MSIRLRDTMLVPPEGFWFRNPDTGAYHNGGNLDATVKLLLAERIGNKAARATYDECLEDVENQICHRVSGQFCMDSNYVYEPITLEDIQHGARAMLAYAKEKLSGGDPFVDQATADARALICSRCFRNIQPKGCFSCWLADKFRELLGLTIGNRVTASDEKLAACSVCKCSGKVFVWYREDILEATNTPEHQAIYNDTPSCWRSKA